MYTLAFVCTCKHLCGCVCVYYLMVEVILDMNVKFAYLMVPIGMVC